MPRSTVLIAIACTALLSACSSAEPPPTPERLRAIRIAAVEHGPAIPPIVGTGVLAPQDEARLAFKVGGIIRELNVRNGDSVQSGQVLATLETAEIDASVSQAEEGYGKARRDLERGRRLFEDDVITQEQLDDLGTAAAVAEAQLRAARFNRRYAEIRAPSDGIVLQRLSEPRELVAAGQPVLRVSRARSGWVLKLGLPDRDFVRVSLGDPAELRFDAYPERTLAGRVSQLGGATDPRTGTFPVEIEIDAGDIRLASGLIGKAEIKVSSDSTLDYVPLTALVEGDSKATLLFTYDAEQQTVTAMQRPVRFVNAEYAALGEPLPPGSRVVTEGAAYLHDGERVRVID